jgi:uncharacterized protein DUF1905
MNSILAELKLIGINAYISVPNDILNELFILNNKNNGPIPIKGKINTKEYEQSLVKYKGEWRLYVNNKMLKNSNKFIGQNIEISIEYDSSDRSLVIHPKLVQALNKNQIANERYNNLAPSLQKEMNKYIYNLKSDVSIDRSINKSIDFLLGKGRFLGRNPLK